MRSTSRIIAFMIFYCLFFSSIKSCKAQSNIYKSVKIYGIPIISLEMVPYSYTPDILFESSKYRLEFDYASPLFQFTSVLEKLKVDSLETKILNDSYKIKSLRTVIEYKDYKNNPSVSLWVDSHYSVWKIDHIEGKVYQVVNPELIVDLLEEQISIFFHFKIKE